MEVNTIHLGDNIEILQSFPDESVDLVFADPPYNLQLTNNLYRPNESKYNGVEDDWDKFPSLAAYDSYTEQWLTECRRVMKPDASIWVIGSYHNIFRIGKILQDLGFWILNDVIWWKVNPTPNFNGTRFTNAHETLIWAAKSKKSKYHFNYNAMKRFNDDKQMRSDWYVPICQGSKRLKINGEKAHSTQKPESLLYRVILASTKINDVILDPFFGTGTTGAAAKRLQRNYIGIEQNAAYYHVAQMRLDTITAVDDDILYTTYSRKTATRVKFADLLAARYLTVGQTLYSADKQYEAKVKSDGTLTILIDDIRYTGSLHKTAAKIQNRRSANGWDFWYVEVNQQFSPIDVLRQQYRKNEFNEEVEEIL